VIRAMARFFQWNSLDSAAGSLRAAVARLAAALDTDTTNLHGLTAQISNLNERGNTNV
jgi:hypothetical protein